jgi:hypothetical protein
MDGIALAALEPRDEQRLLGRWVEAPQDLALSFAQPLGRGEAGAAGAPRLRPCSRGNYDCHY